MHLDYKRFVEGLPDKTLLLYCGDSCINKLAEESPKVQFFALESSNINQLDSDDIQILKDLSSDGLSALVLMDHFPCRVSSYFGEIPVAQKLNSAEYLVHELISLMKLESLESILELHDCAVIGAVIDELREEIVDFIELSPPLHN
ncbi:hypothetical protein [Phaeocystidibacter marisrubri]|uniref:Uncharacterized protein n=1 Tax=Phaeocystidibacter marisrubri TaxID=1577780 RepID=A0A6L3ZE09_9FLAO|nr:hypothetical protein [Phaeocystidibacter marisrubri]KAB2815856.1 hypothetical protein F8C82_09160 [Phaeocystidibacter marisrubri]GGH66072.1 hypothetical protein GCM10011318_03670 [Phaeocystidibacter marisrubri]